MTVASVLAAGPATPGAAQKVNLILNVFVAIGGVFYVYEQSSRDMGIDLIRKFIVLGWVIVCRGLLIMIPVGLGLYTAAGVAGIEAALVLDIVVLA